MATENEDKDNIIAAKQAISPKGLMDQSAEGNSGVGAELDAPELPHNEREETYMNGDEPAEDVPMTHPNRSPGNAGIDQPGYGGGHLDLLVSDQRFKPTDRYGSRLAQARTGSGYARQEGVRQRFVLNRIRRPVHTARTGSGRLR